MEEDKVLDTNLLIDGQTGLTTILNVIEYPKALERDGLSIIWPNRSDYLEAIELMTLLFQSGKTIPAIDVLLSAICLNRKKTLVTKDRHFEYVKAVKEDLLLEIIRTGKKQS